MTPRGQNNERDGLRNIAETVAADHERVYMTSRSELATGDRLAMPWGETWEIIAVRGERDGKYLWFDYMCERDGKTTGPHVEAVSTALLASEVESA